MSARWRAGWDASGRPALGDYAPASQPQRHSARFAMARGLPCRPTASLHQPIAAGRSRAELARRNRRMLRKGGLLALGVVIAALSGCSANKDGLPDTGMTTEQVNVSTAIADSPELANDGM